MLPLKHYAAAGLILLGLGGSALYAQPMMPQHPRAGMHKNEERHPLVKLLEQLNLSEAQKAELETLKTTFEAERNATRPDQNRAQDLADAISEEGLDGTQFLQVVQERCTARASVREQHLVKILDVLSGSQRLELKALLESQADNRPHEGEEN